MASFDLADVGFVEFDAAWVADRWARPGFRLQRDGWVITDPAGAIVAYLGAIQLDDVLDSEGVVHPAHVRRGLGSALVDLLERRAAETPELRAVQGWTIATDDPAARLLRDRGYSPERSFVHLERDLTDLPPGAAPDVAGISIRPMRIGEDDLGTLRIIDDAFRGTWDWARVRMSPDEWASELRSGDPIPAAATLVAEDHGRAVGFVLTRDRKGAGWVEWLAVDPEHHRRGIGEALLRKSFRALRDGGFTHARVNVDAENESRAYVLYERVGMREFRRFVAFRKPLP